MKTPIVDFVREYAASKTERCHMPGHKGQALLGCEPLDITEIEGADVLYSPTGIIRESEENAARLFGASHTIYSTQGSTLCIQAMVGAVCQRAERKGERPLLLAARNVHRAFVSACALFDADVRWLFPKEGDGLLRCTVTPDEVEQALSASQKTPVAVYLTSPDYLGNAADVEGIARVCNAHGVPLLVDNAHGAYLRFLSPSRHPINLGAAMCCDSAHKTLPVLTGGAYLHVSPVGEAYLDAARSALSLLASTSPSYLILQSLDLCNRLLSEEFPRTLVDFAKRVQKTRERLTDKGWSFVGDEGLKLTVAATHCGYTGVELGAQLREAGFEPELCDGEHVVLMLSPQNGEALLPKLEDFLQALPKKAPLTAAEPKLAKGERVLSIREACLAPRECVPVSEAEGRISATVTASCPPAVPIAVSGERITRDMIDLFLHYGVNTVEVVK